MAAASAALMKGKPAELIAPTWELCSPILEASAETYLTQLQD
jgi:hypothetical protein